MPASSTYLPSLFVALSLAGCAQTPDAMRSEPEPRETEWRFGSDADVGQSTDTDLGFTALPVTTRAPRAAEDSAVPAKPKTGVAEPLSGSPEPATGAPSEGSSATKPTERRSLTISLGEQAFEYKEGAAVVRSGPISSGKPGNPTPTGRFRVLSKNADKVSSRYTNQLGMQAWMPYAIQFYGHYFLHEGWLPGYPDSHGCVRVGEQDARFLFERLRIGDPVLVVR